MVTLYGFYDYLSQLDSDILRTHNKVTFKVFTGGRLIGLVITGLILKLYLNYYNTQMCQLIRADFCQSIIKKATLSLSNFYTTYEPNTLITKLTSEVDHAIVQYVIPFTNLIIWSTITVTTIIAVFILVGSSAIFILSLLFALYIACYKFSSASIKMNHKKILLIIRG